MRVARASANQEYLHLKGVAIPIFVYQEYRSSVRVSFASRGINLRVPKAYSSGQVRDQITWCKEWVREQIRKKPALVYKYIKRDYKNGYVLPLFDRDLTIQIKADDAAYITCSIRNNEIMLRHPYNGSELSPDIIRKKIIQVLNRTYQKALEQRLTYINDLTLKASYDSVNLKYLKTQWGNCGVQGVIKLSTRLLLLPEKIQNAILLHELVHLKHFNHGPEFYTTLNEYMPDYDKRMKWLKGNESYLDF